MSPRLIIQFRDHAAALSASILALEQSLPTPNTIQQAELMLQVTARQLKRLANQQRAHLLARLDFLAAVQPGPYGVRIQVQHRRSLSHASLRSAIGEEALQALLDRVSPTESRRLVIAPIDQTNRRRSRRPEWRS